MRKFGEKSTTAQTVFIVSHINHAEGEDGVLEWDVDYFLEQRDVE